MNISGVLVTASPGRSVHLQQRLETLTGVEVHAQTPAGQLVVTLEAETDEQTQEALGGLERLEHVQCAALVYHYRDPVEEA
ncbi:MAG: chaperone NapD [Pseudomonadota bacterium]